MTVQNGAALPIVALTGGTGFIGRRLAPLLAAAGWRVRLLLRRDPVCPEWRGMNPQIVAGDLGDSAALAQLTSGVDAVVHVAGLIKAGAHAALFHGKSRRFRCPGRGRAAACTAGALPASFHHCRT